MGELISVIFSDILMFKMEFNVVVPDQTLHYNHYVGETYACKEENTRNMVSGDFNSDHQKIKLTKELNSSKLLHTELSSLYNRVATFPLDISAILLLGNFIKQIE